MELLLKQRLCYFEFLTPETMKLFGSTKSKITKAGNGENISHLKITGVALVHCKIQDSFIHLLLINRVVNYHPNITSF